MPLPENHAVFGTAGCGCHQQVMGGALASGDFTNIATNNAADGVYTLNGETVTIGDIVDLEHDFLNFDPVLDIDAGGIKSRPTGVGLGNTGRNLPLKDPLRSDLIANGFTAVIEMDLSDDEGGGAGTAVGNIYLYDMPFNVDTTVTIKRDYRQCNNGGETGALDGVQDGVPDLAEGIHKIAITCTVGRQAISTDGGAVVSDETGMILPGMTEVEIAMGGSLACRLRSFVFYEVVDDADLPTLSAL